MTAGWNFGPDALQSAGWNFGPDALQSTLDEFMADKAEEAKRHDPLCGWRWFYHPAGRSVDNCECDLIRRVRADADAATRERYAQRILAADANYGYRLNADDAAEILRAGDS